MIALARTRIRTDSAKRRRAPTGLVAERRRLAALVRRSFPFDVSSECGIMTRVGISQLCWRS
jgi:hypothetical protein